VSRLPIRLRLTLAFALAMAVVLAAVGGFLAAVVLPPARMFLPKLQMAPSPMPTH
jgi:hypothetical protein